MQRIAINIGIGGFYLTRAGADRLVALGHPKAVEWARIDREYASARRPREHETFPWPIARDDALLIQVIDQMGAEAAGREVIVVEVPDGVEWGIADSDPGYEWVYEAHRTWSVGGERVKCYKPW